MKIKYFAIGLLSLVYVSCSKSLDTKPINLILASDQFSTDTKANDAVVGVYSSIYGSTVVIAPLNSNLSIYTGLSADELYTTYTGTNAQALYSANTLIATDGIAQQFWSAGYNNISQANTIIDNVAASIGISAAGKSQFTGEAKFLRSFCYFYLVNMFGDVPLVTSSIYTDNLSTPRTPVKQVYQQMVTDLTSAAGLLPDTYPTSGKVRANKSAALALLARVYLYTQDWANAEAKASLVINNGTYALEPSYSNIFLSASKEAIFQFWTPLGYTLYEGNGGVAPSGTTYHYGCNTNFINTFEAGDLRKAAFTNTVIIKGVAVTYPYKYKNTSTISNGTTEYYMALRLSEQYLIRAEARAMQNNIAGAVTDVNIIRSRAGLAPLAASIGQADLLTAISHERRVELCFEWGDRWFDLKRTGRVNAVLSALKPATWKPISALYPIPYKEIQNNSNLVQNLGY